jgi:hypothetical protein
MLILKLVLQTSKKMAWTELLRLTIGINLGLLWTQWWTLCKATWHPHSAPCPVHVARNTQRITATLTWHTKARGSAHWLLIVSQLKAPVEKRSTQSMYNMVLYKSVRSTILSDNIQQVTRGLRLIFSLWLIHLYTQNARVVCLTLTTTALSQ